MAAARLATVGQMTGAWAEEYLLNVPQPMATAEDVVDTSGEAVYQFVPRQDFQSGLDSSTFFGRPLGWGDALGAHADAYTPRVEIGGSSHGGHEPLQRVPGLELHFGLLEDTASRSEYQPGCSDPHPGNDQQRVLLTFRKGEDDAVTILVRDRESLQPQTFLGNNIIDFYIKFLARKIPSEERNRFYFFNSSFITKLLGSSSTSSDIDRCEADYDQVRKWTTEVNLFEKDYVFIPVLRSSHWSLIIMCNLGSVASTPEKRNGLPACIFHLDPVEGKHESFEGQMRRYLYRACRERYQGSNEKDDMLEALACNMKYVRAQVPRQDNSYDCGVYVLHYVEVFLRVSTSPGFSFTTSKEVAHFTSPHFAVEVSAKRQAIQNLIDDLSRNPQELAARRVDVQPKPQPNAAKACSPRPQPKRSSKPPKGRNKISKKWEKEETSVLLNRLEERGRIRKGATQWDLISQDINTKYCGTIRSDDECRRRYDTLLKAFKKIKEKARKPFCDITAEERREWNLATPLREEWYNAIGRICVQRSSENTKSGKRAKLNASDGTGMLSFRPPAPSIPSGRPQPERPTQKQVAVPGFRSLDGDLRSTLLNLIQASSVKEWSNWRELWISEWSETAEDFLELEVLCQRLAIVQDRKPSHIRRLVHKLSDLKLVTIQLQMKDILDLESDSIYEEVPCLNLLNLRVYKKFLEKVLCKNPHFNTYLQMCDNDDFVSFPEVPPLPLSLQRIRVLSLRDCLALEHADLSNFRELRLLVINGCTNLKSITGWEAVKELGWLEIRDCDSYADFPPVQCLPSLREFCVNQDFASPGKHSALRITWAPDFSQCVRLRRLELDWSRDDLPPLNNVGLSTLRFLEVLSLRSHNALTTLEGLSGLHALTHLDLGWCRALRRVPELGCLKALTRLDMTGSGVEEIPGVQELHLLTFLVLRWCDSLTALPCLGHLKALAHLEISRSLVEEIPGVQDLVSLETLLCSYSRLKVLPDLHHLPRLRKVWVCGTPLSKESNPSSSYHGKGLLLLEPKEESFVDDISDVSDTE